MVTAMNKKAALPLAISQSCTPSTHAKLMFINCGFRVKKKKHILEKYISKFGSGYQGSIIPKKKGKHDHNKLLPSLASSWQCMKPSTNKYY
jgi:hypothetical protein